MTKLKTKINKKKNELIASALDERKRNILFAIIKTYLETGEPVGSRTISKLLDEQLSSATIRNEMSDLEDMDYIIQPHTSSGRIPSDKGYRMYVDNLIKEKEKEINTLKNEMVSRVDRLETMMKGIVESIAKNTNYGALISGPSISKHKIKYVQISNLEAKKILLVVVSEGNVIKTNIVDVKKAIIPDEMVDISIELNELLSGKSIDELSESKFLDEVAKVKVGEDIVKHLIESIKVMCREEEDKDTIFTYGANNFFKYKELKENEAATTLLETFERKNELREFIDKNSEDENAINVYIGEESHLPSMKDCSVVTANLNFGSGLTGKVAVVGPKRMDYEKVLKTLTKLLSSASDEFSNF